VVPIVVIHAILLSVGWVGCLEYSLSFVVLIVVMHAMCLNGVWVYLRNIEADKQRQVRAFV
jgi:hypothetical protein